MLRIGQIMLFLLLPVAWADSSVDRRTLVEMPAETQALLRLEMMDHMAAINELIGYLGNGDLDSAATAAEERMGLSSMGKHRSKGSGPGRFMPPEMRQIGVSMHMAASEFAKTAAQGDLQPSVAALQQVTAACVACHNAYRVR
jgi:hypothetical protein